MCHARTAGPINNLYPTKKFYAPSLGQGIKPTDGWPAGHGTTLCYERRFFHLQTRAVLVVTLMCVHGAALRLVALDNSALATAEELLFRGKYTEAQPLLQGALTGFREDQG